MALDPQARAVLDQMAAMVGPSINGLPVSDARNQAADRTGVQGVPEVVATMEDRKLPGFFTMMAMIDQGKKAVQPAAAALRTAFSSCRMGWRCGQVAPKQWQANMSNSNSVRYY
jgi:hypothetical protein